MTAPQVITIIVAIITVFAVYFAGYGKGYKDGLTEHMAFIHCLFTALDKAKEQSQKERKNAEEGTGTS